MSDELLLGLKNNGGVIQINFGSSFLDSAVVRKNNVNRDKLRALLDEQGLTSDDSLAAPIIEQFSKDNPSLYADVETVADHIDHGVQLIGIDHVGIGSDYDGVGDSLPTGLKDVSQYPNLIFVLLKRGYSPADIEKICSGNLFRVWNKVIEVSNASM
jgi:membrane dipeptidase